MLKNCIIFDIETGGLPEDQIEIPEFEAPSNYKSAEAISKYNEKKKAEYIEKAALSVFTGEVLAIGYRRYNLDGACDPIKILHGLPEDVLIKEFWNMINNSGPDSKIIGWNSNGFDMPFMIRKSWKYGLDNTPQFLSDWNRPLPRYIDLMQMWGCGSHEYTKLDTAAKYFGVGQKNGDGKFFKEMYKEDPDKAVAYLTNDVDITDKVAEKMLFL